jgi:glucan phosphoethanolaminetransferase (alkaline phosphatase superfamily)
MTQEEKNSKEELLTRLELIESMLLEGRKTTSYHGWTFLLWGVAFLVAIGWMEWLPHGELAWVVTMPVTALFSAILGSRLRTCKWSARSLAAIWIAVSAALFLYMFSVGYSGHAEMHTLWAAMETLLGVANCASAIMLRWRVQMGVAILWWIAAAASCFVPAALLIPILAGATLFCQVGFGLYLIYLERRDQKLAVQHG